MNVAEIFIDLDKIGKIVEGWDSDSNISALERDLVLDKLKAIYEQVLFVGPVQSESANEMADMIPIDLSVGINELVALNFDKQEVAEIEQETEAVVLEQQDEALEQQQELGVLDQFEVLEQQELNEDAELVVEAESQTTLEPLMKSAIEPAFEPIVEVVVETKTEKEIESESEVKPQLEPEVKLESLQVAHSKRDMFELKESEPSAALEPIEEANQSLFAEESIPTKPKIDRRVILSLYGDEPMSEQPMIAEPAVAERSKELPKEQSTEQHDEQGRVNDVPQLTTVDKPHNTVLGEVIGKGGHTVGDRMFTVVDKVDVATKVVTDQSTSLRKMIGINDKFLMIRDLFGGNASAYEHSINTLEVFVDLDDVLIYIHETYSWNPNSEGVKLLIELLTRKLSQ